MTGNFIEHRIELLLTAAMSDQPSTNPTDLCAWSPTPLALVQQDTADDKGRCQFGTSRWRWRRISCPAVQFTPSSVPTSCRPTTVAQRQIPDLPHQHHTSQASTRTTPLPKRLVSARLLQPPTKREGHVSRDDRAAGENLGQATLRLTRLADRPDDEPTPPHRDD
jgi:hypothetical protein